MLDVINTRPSERADGLNQALQQAGYSVTQLPLLELVAEPFALIQQPLSTIRQVAVVVVVSPAAAQLGLAGLQQLGILPGQLDCQWVAVGQGTAKILQQTGLTVQIPTLETSEGMLALEVFQPPTQTDQSAVSGLGTVMFWRGYGGRQFMLKQLASQQAVLSVNLYRRQLPASSSLHYQHLLDQHRLEQHMVDHPQVLLISSGVSWQHWLELGQQFGWIMPCYILVLGQRVYQQIHQYISQHCQAMRSDLAKPPRVILLDNLEPATLLMQLEQLQKCQ
ncbi:MAG: uroporphyrinogen-III synthase [Moraxellaceae bacterium]|nr:MAG: uroporphyrinogen-III synthase [Moraxellaceae bacterium]